MTATTDIEEMERVLGERVYAAIQHASNFSERSQQAHNYQIGVSDLGTCSERTRRLIAEIPEADPSDKLAAFVGTAVGDHTERAIAALYPEAKIGTEVSVNLTGDAGRAYVVSGHPDVVQPWGVIDIKTVDGLEVVRRTGPDQQQLFQRHLYTKGAYEAGLLDVELEDAMTANIWIDRSGATKGVHVHMDHYSEDVVNEAARWLDAVVYAHTNGLEAMKEPPRQWCEKVCGHFADCRMFDSDVSGLITDETYLTAVEIYREGKAQEKAGKTMAKEAQAALAGVEGYTPDGFQVRWSHVNDTTIETFVRRGYDRLNIVKPKGS